MPRKKFLSKTLVLISAIIFLAFPRAALAKLVINPDNPYFLFNDGRFIVSWANNNHGAPLGEMTAHKVNHYEISVLWIDGQGDPLSGNRFPSDGNINFNEGYFSSLRNEIISAGNQGIAVTIVLYGGPHFEGDRTAGSRFGQNPWNACLGGPIDIGTCPYQESGAKSPGGFREFLTLESYDYNNPLTSQYSNYSKSWPVPRKIQYRQEEILNKFQQELGDLDNWLYNVLWEINDNPDGSLTRQWASWFANYVHKKDTGRLVFTGEQPSADYASSIASIDGSEHEGMNDQGNIEDLARISNSKPKVVIGYDPWDSSGSIVDKLCNGGAGDVSGKKNVDYMRRGLLAGNGVHPGTPFHFKNCGGDKEGILDYLKVLQDFLETVDYWGNEPGDEINDSTTPTWGNYKNFDVSANDRSDGQGKKGWPRWGGGFPSPTPTPTGGPSLSPTPGTATPTPTIVPGENPVVTNLNPSSYQLATLDIGSQYYIDRTYTLTSVPTSYLGAVLIKTANDDKHGSSVEVSFTVDRDSIVYVGFDPRVTSPSWLTSSFTQTGEVLVTTAGGKSNLDIWRGEFPKGVVVLGANDASGDPFSSMYIVFLQGTGEPGPIQGDLDQDGDVDIFDYNLLVTNFGSNNCGNVADINSDCKVDIFDYNTLIENFGV